MPRLMKKKSEAILLKHVGTLQLILFQPRRDSVSVRSLPLLDPFSLFVASPLLFLIVKFMEALHAEFVL
ncbi:hypothetical protein ACOSP7_021121 [Xanthoceras sorbifolium]